MATDYERFNAGERRLHWGTALTVLFLGTTGLAIWAGYDKWELAGVEALPWAHFWLGGGSLLGGVVGYLAWRSPPIVAAAKRLNFGQRVNLLVMQVLLGGMFASGLVIHFGRSWGMTKPVRSLIKQGHLTAAMGVGLVILAHLVMVFVVAKNRGIVRAMLTGRVDAEVARRSAPAWVAEIEATERENP